MDEINNVENKLDNNKFKNQLEEIRKFINNYINSTNTCDFIRV